MDLLVVDSVSAALEHAAVRWALDLATTGVVIFDVELVRAASPAPLHWRAGDWTKPPMDLSLNEAGELESIQFVLQDESVRTSNVQQLHASEPGCPRFAVHHWSADRYVDVTGSVDYTRLPSGEFYASIGDVAPERSLSTTGVLRFDVDTWNHLVGIAVGPLSTSDWELIEASAPLS